ncbi:hypothetical protein PF007_g27642 [Phytophthora fragariae]|uniref:DUF7869 domain-containing protein n=2 Tax=Phytophthora fragariae TaxID=53985 RepID=A0A6A3Q568_9STRA|nr:hypothetical protein PF007_g27642 [Phytophthora fragariae]
MEAHHPSPERQPTVAHQQQLQPASTSELPPSDAPTLQSPSATDLPPASALELQPPCTPELQPSPERQSYAVSSAYQRATADLESGLASVNAQPLLPPPSLRKRCLRGTSPHVESEGICGASNPGSSSSEEPDDINDEDWSTAESAEEYEEVAVDSGGDDSGEEDICVNLIEVDVNLKVTDLIRVDNCERRCLDGKARELESLVCSISQMTKLEKMTSVYSMLGVLMQTDTVQRRRVIKFLLAQVHMGVLNRIDYKFFVKGHTKNSCDRGFGHIRKFVSRQDCWTLGQVVSAVRDSATSNRTVHISCDDGFFKGYKSLVKELYKNLTGVQQYQWFEMDASQPGMVDCRKSPSADAEEQYLRRKVDGILTENTKVARMFEHFLESLSVPGVNTEKKYTMHYVVRPYVPEEFRGDEIYAALSKEQDDSAKAAKQSRHQHPAAMALTAKENLDQRGRGVQEEEEEATVAKKKPR